MIIIIFIVWVIIWYYINLCLIKYALASFIDQSDLNYAKKRYKEEGWRYIFLFIKK